MDAELRSRLLKEFEPEVEELNSLLGPSVCCEGHSVVGIVARGDPTADNINVRWKDPEYGRAIITKGLLCARGMQVYNPLDSVLLETQPDSFPRPSSEDHRMLSAYSGPETTT